MRKFFSLRFCVVLLVLVLCPLAAEAQTRVHYINVGQADAILLELNKAVVMIDAGGEATNNPEENTHLIDYLNKVFERRPDLNRTIHTIIISHPHMDHTMKLPDVVSKFNVLHLIDGGENADILSGIVPLRSAREFVRSHGGEVLAINDSQVTAQGFKIAALESLHSLDPTVSIKLLSGSRGCKNANNSSLVVLATLNGARFIFTGDAEDLGKPPDCLDEITTLINRFKGTNQLRADVFKVDHHGSDNGNNNAWMKSIAPRISIISAGKPDAAHHPPQAPGDFHAFEFGHPRETAVKRIENGTTTNRPAPATVITMDGVPDKNGVGRFHKPPRVMKKAVYCTCWDGNIVVEPSANGTSLTVKTQQ